MANSILRMDHPFEKLVSVKYNDGDGYTATIDNGHVLTLDGLISGENEIFKGIAPSAITKEIVIVAGVELNNDESSRTYARLDTFTNKANKPFRTFIPEFGKIFSVSDDALVKIGAASVVGNFVIIKANVTTLEEKAALGGTESFAGQIIAKETVAGTVMAVIKIVKCQ